MKSHEKMKCFLQLHRYTWWVSKINACSIHSRSSHFFFFYSSFVNLWNCHFGNCVCRSFFQLRESNKMSIQIKFFWNCIQNNAQQLSLCHICRLVNRNSKKNLFLEKLILLIFNDSYYAIYDFFHPMLRNVVWFIFGSISQLFVLHQVL